MFVSIPRHCMLVILAPIDTPHNNFANSGAYFWDISPSCYDLVKDTRDMYHFLAFPSYHSYIVPHQKRWPSGLISNQDTHKKGMG